MIVGNGDIIGFAAEVILVYDTQPIGKTEKDVVLLSPLRAIGKDILSRILLGDTGKHAHIGIFRHLQLLEHQAQLLSILGHKLGFTAGEHGAAVTDGINLLCHQLGHLGGASRLHNLLGEQGARINPRLLLGRSEGHSGGLRLHLGIDSQQCAVFGELQIAGSPLAIEFQAVTLGSISHPLGLYIDRYEAIGHGGRSHHLVEFQVFLGIRTELTGSITGFLHLYGNAQLRLGQIIDSAIGLCARHIFGDRSLSPCQR